MEHPIQACLSSCENRHFPGLRIIKGLAIEAAKCASIQMTKGKIQEPGFILSVNSRLFPLQQEGNHKNQINCVCCKVYFLLIINKNSVSKQRNWDYNNQTRNMRRGFVPIYNHGSGQNTFHGLLFSQFFSSCLHLFLLKSFTLHDSEVHETRK